MSTHTRLTDTEPTPTARSSISTRNAPKTFSPHNTNPCPRMFADKWQDDSQQE